MTSLWAFTTAAQLTYVYTNQWLPSAPREHDKFLMDYFNTCQFASKTMESLNRCRIFLRAITLSDITTADGSRLLLGIKSNRHTQGRRSRLDWPQQDKPSKRDWTLWSEALTNLETNDKLSQPLGKWVAPTHQIWEYFLSPQTLEVYHIVAIGTYHYHSIIHQNPRTRSQQSQWYDRSQVIHDNARPPAATVPVTIIQNPAATRSIFQVETDMTLS